MNRGSKSLVGWRLWRQTWNFKYRGAWFSSVVMLGLLLSPNNLLSQGTIRYEAEDLGDVVVGEDLWVYRFYLLSGFNFGAGQGLSIFFDAARYAELAEASSSSLDPLWDRLVVQPDGLLGDGFFDAQALGPVVPSPGVPFVVEFVWLGGAGNVPGALSYYTYAPDFSVLAEGTTSLVPEPGTGVLLGLGGLVWGLWRRGVSARREA